MTQIDDLLEAVRQKASRQDGCAFFIAIDGHSAAGKSTFSRALADAWPEAALVETDDFYRVMDPDVRFGLDAGAGYRRYYDWERLLRDVLMLLKRGEDARFQIYDWGENSLGEWRDIPASPFVIVEGCYSARPEFEAIMDFTVLVETNAELRQRRQEERADASDAWLLRWNAAERFYLETTGFRARADMIVRGQ